MAITWQQVVDIAPETASAPSGMQTAILDEVNSRAVADAAWWSTAEADDGRKYLAAHLATVGKSRGKGQVTAESEGQMSRDYASTLALGIGALGMTSYGAEYERRAQNQIGRLGFVAG